ncbi:MAG: hypothetical protein CMP49_04030 [Flavobacteriales bacterium]|nr:hypothetical protein [Flavobacteriales bacterium]|tara:strand:- start:9 stop:332 length:324 start_codon:yes stop_codon:yes gene_type:complete
MVLSKLINNTQFKSNDLFRDLFDVRAFVILFTVFSIISISCANRVYNKTSTIESLKRELQNLKSEYVSTKTILMMKSKRSHLIEQAEVYGLIESNQPLQIIYLEDEY